MLPVIHPVRFSHTADFTATFNRRRAIACAAAAVLGGLVYINALHNLFVDDDHRMILENFAIQHLSDA